MNRVIARNTEDNPVHQPNESLVLRYQTTFPIVFDNPRRTHWGMWESTSRKLSGLDDWKMELSGSALSSHEENANPLFTGIIRQFHPITRVYTIRGPSAVVVDADITAIPSIGGNFFFDKLSPSEDLPQTNRNAWAHSSPSYYLDPLNIGRQLSEMKALEDGWAEGMQPAEQWGHGYGKAPSPYGLDWLTWQFNDQYQFDLPRPYLYPTPEGGVQAEWSIGPNEASLEIDLETHQAEWHCLNVLTNSSNEHELELDNPDAWAWIGVRLRELRSTQE